MLYRRPLELRIQNLSTLTGFVTWRIKGKLNLSPSALHRNVAGDSKGVSKIRERDQSNDSFPVAPGQKIHLTVRFTVNEPLDRNDAVLCFVMIYCELPARPK